MKTTSIPTAVVTVPSPSKAHAGYAIALKIDGIACIVVTAREQDIEPMAQAIGFLTDINMTKVMPVAVLSIDSVKVIG